MKSNKIPHHPSNNSDNWSDVGTEIELLRTAGAFSAVSASAAFANDNRLLRSDGTARGAQASPITVDDSGNVSGAGTYNGNAVPVPTQKVAASFTYVFPADGTERPIINAPFQVTWTKVTARTKAGTATVTSKIDGVAFGGSANSASTSENAQTHASANVMAVGTDLEVTFSSTSGNCEGLTLTYEGTMVLA